MARGEHEANVRNDRVLPWQEYFCGDTAHEGRRDGEVPAHQVAWPRRQTTETYDRTEQWLGNIRA